MRDHTDARKMSLSERMGGLLERATCARPTLADLANLETFMREHKFEIFDALVVAERQHGLVKRVDTKKICRWCGYKLNENGLCFSHRFGGK